MSTQVIKGQMQISRNSDNMINIQVKDQASSVKMLDIKLTLEEYAMLVTGCSQSDLYMEVKDLDLVGKYKVREARQIIYRGHERGKLELQQWLIENAQEEGWIVDPYLGSQSSVRYVGKEAILSYSVHKYTDTPQGD